jgi:hypothetical protein
MTSRQMTLGFVKPTNLGTHMTYLSMPKQKLVNFSVKKSVQLVPKSLLACIYWVSVVNKSIYTLILY